MTFSVEPDALETLSSELRQLDNSTGYGNVCMANDAKSYNQQQIKLSRPGSAGMIFFLVHSQTEELREAIGGTLDKSSTALDGSATEVHLTAERYNSLDEQARQELDAAYPGGGASEPYSLAPGCPISPLMVLTEPPAIFPTDWYSKIITNDWLSPSATVSSLIDLVFDWNPINEVAKVFTGDWDDMERVAGACEVLGNYFGALTSAAKTEAGNCMQSWTGEAADAASAWFKKFADFGSEVEGKFDELRGHYVDVSLTMASYGNLLAGLLAQIMDALIYAALLAAAAVVTVETIIGTIVFGALAIFEATKVANLITEAYGVIKDAGDYIDAFTGTVALISSAISARTMEVTVPSSYDNAQV